LQSNTDDEEESDSKDVISDSSSLNSTNLIERIIKNPKNLDALCKALCDSGLS
jgi:hypothetical protein